MLTTPILFIVFNRPIHTQKVFEKIRYIKPKKLYIAIDGPRKKNKFDNEKIKKVLKIFENIDWDCKVLFLKRKKNLGCKVAVSEAIDWFFNNENKGIILEDDCVPSPDFFIFCQELLIKYENNLDVYMITGDNFQDGIVRGEGSYYFSKLTHVWGWATWKRAWSKYDIDISFWPEFKKSSEFKKIFDIKLATNYFSSIFDAVYKKKIDTWDYQWNACVWFNKGVSITPNKNLVTNIGFGPEATHTKDIKEKYKASRKYHKILPLKHLDQLVRDKKADEYVFFNSLGGSERTLLKRLIRKIKLIFEIN
jgi:hypothetical protein